jgi:hypothetical protein
MSEAADEITTAVTAKGQRVEITTSYDAVGRVEQVSVQAWDNSDGEPVSTQQMTGYALGHLRHPILMHRKSCVDGDGNGYVLGIYT